MRRREFITLIGGAVAWSLAARAQQAGNIPRIGFLRVGPPPAAFIDGFRQGLREQGLVEDQHFVIEYSLAQGAAQVPDAAAELVRRKVDIIVASGTPSVMPASDAAGKDPRIAGWPRLHRSRSSPPQRCHANPCPRNQSSAGGLTGGHLKHHFGAGYGCDTPWAKVLAHP